MADVIAKKRKLRALLSAGSQPAEVVRKVDSNVTPVPQTHVRQQQRVECGGFLREAAEHSQPHAVTVPSTYAQPAALDEDSDDDIALHDSDVLLAIKYLLSSFPKNHVPQSCPPLAFYTQLKETLSGRSGLQLDKELNKLRESRDIVMFKFATSQNDTAVTLRSEFQQVLSQVLKQDCTNDATDGAAQGRHDPASSAGTTNTGGSASKQEAVQALTWLIDSGRFEVQMPPDKLADALVSVSNENNTDNGDTDGSQQAQRGAGAAAAGAITHAAVPSNDSQRDSRPSTSLHSNSRGAPGTSYSARGAARRAGHGASGGSGMATSKHGQGMIDELIRVGLLVRHRVGPVEVMRLTAPGIGSVVASVERARRDITGMLKRKKRKEAIQKSLCDQPLTSSRLGWNFHISDMIGAGLLQRFSNGNNDVLKLAQT